MADFMVPAHGALGLAFKAVDGAGHAAEMDITNNPPVVSLGDSTMGGLEFKYDADDIYVWITWMAPGTTTLHVEGDRRQGADFVSVMKEMSIEFAAAEPETFTVTGNLTREQFDVGPVA
jgi:hypothetical protein